MEDNRGVVHLGMPDDQMPGSKDLHRFLTDYCKYWRDIGVQLGLKSSVLDLVASAHPMQDRECFRVTLEKWLQLNVGVTWSNLELAITNANRENLGLQPLAAIPISQTGVEIIQSEPRKGNDVVAVKKQFRDLIIINLRKTYSKVIKKLIHIFKEKKFDIEELITILRFDDVDKKSVFSTDEVFTAIRTEMELFQHVGHYCKSIYDYRLLDVLVQASECPEAIKELNDFTKSLHNSILTEIDLISEYGELLHPDDFMPGTYKFIIEYVGGKCTIETKEMVQGIVEQCVHLKKGVLIFKGVDVGSILFIYQISEAVKNYLLQYKFTEQDVTFLEGNNITSLTVDGFRIIPSESQPNKDEATVQLESKVLQQLNNLVTALSPQDQEATLSTLKKIFDNIIQYPNDDKHRQIELKDDTFSNTVWQYSAGKELIKMSGWVLEDDHVKLRDDSCVQILSQSLKSFLSSSATGVVPLLDDEFQVLINAFYNGDIPCIQKLLKASHISPNGRIYSESGSSLNLFYSATIAQQIDIIKLLMTDYSILFMYNDLVLSFFSCIFSYARQSFIVAVLRYYGIIIGSEFIEIGTSLLHFAVYTNCFDVICFLLKECGNIDVNATDDSLRTPLHYAYLAGHTQIAQYLIQHGADVLAVDTDGCTPCEYIDGDPNWIMDLEYLQNKRKIHHVAFSIEHCYYMNLVNLGIDEEEVVSLTMEQFPSLKERPTQPHHDIIDHATALKEFTQYITN